MFLLSLIFFFFFNDTATTEIYTSVNTLSYTTLFRSPAGGCGSWFRPRPASRPSGRSEEHTSELQSLTDISYAVFCLKKKKQKTRNCNTKNSQTIRHDQHRHPR